jgi:hypothetical protein
MFNFLKEKISNWKYRREIADIRKRGKDKNYWAAHMLQNDKKFKKLIPEFERVGVQYYKLLYENEDKTDIEHIFGRLMIQKQTEFFNAIMILTFFEKFSHPFIPLMRNFCDTVLFLKYVEIHPDYIKKFMEKEEGRGCNIRQIINEIDDKELGKYYDFLSDLMHTNPNSVKFTYYKSKNKKQSIMTMTPLNMDEFKEAYLLSLQNFMTESTRIIEKIYSIQWSTERQKKK